MLPTVLWRRRFAGLDRVGKEHCVWNEDTMAGGRADDGGRGLNVFNPSFEACHRDHVAQFKRFVHQQENSREKIPQNIPEGKADRHAGNDAVQNSVGAAPCVR